MNYFGEIEAKAMYVLLTGFKKVDMKISPTEQVNYNGHAVSITSIKVAKGLKTFP